MHSMLLVSFRVVSVSVDALSQPASPKAYDQMLADVWGDDELFNDFPPLWTLSAPRVGSEEQSLLHQRNALSLQTSINYASVISGRAPSAPLGGTTPRLTLPSDVYQDSQVPELLLTSLTTGCCLCFREMKTDTQTVQSINLRLLRELRQVHWIQPFLWLHLGW